MYHAIYRAKQSFSSSHPLSFGLVFGISSDFDFGFTHIIGLGVGLTMDAPWICLHIGIGSHRIASHRIASHGIASYGRPTNLGKWGLQIGEASLNVEFNMCIITSQENREKTIKTELVSQTHTPQAPPTLLQRVSFDPESSIRLPQKAEVVFYSFRLESVLGTENQP
uniref:HDC19160 n=1 Tax=Drosophila melanogaster TaxID=7227 RepID=Q6IIB3_DROME|nr:TPA_inf: HDC19160 [Drosophila melanogaster]